MIQGLDVSATRTPYLARGGSITHVFINDTGSSGMLGNDTSETLNPKATAQHAHENIHIVLHTDAHIPNAAAIMLKATP